MQTKAKFAEPTMEVVLFSEQDIVTTSGGVPGIPGEGGNPGGGGGIVLPEIPIN